KWFVSTQPPYGTSMPQSGRRPQHQERTSPVHPAMSALPPKADIVLVHSRRQLLAKAAIAASRVAAPTINRLTSPRVSLLFEMRKVASHHFRPKFATAPLQGSSMIFDPVFVWDFLTLTGIAFVAIASLFVIREFYNLRRRVPLDLNQDPESIARSILRLARATRLPRRTERSARHSGVSPLLWSHLW